MLTLLNTSILTTYGEYSYTPTMPGEARKAATEAHASGTLQSAIGHQSTADILATLLGVPVPMNRMEYRQSPGPEDTALVFKLRGRPPEGVILSMADIEAIGYDFGFLVRTA